MAEAAQFGDSIRLSPNTNIYVETQSSKISYYILTYHPHFFPFQEPSGVYRPANQVLWFIMPSDFGHIVLIMHTVCPNVMWLV